MFLAFIHYPCLIGFKFGYTRLAKILGRTINPPHPFHNEPAAVMVEAFSAYGLVGSAAHSRYIVAPSQLIRKSEGPSMYKALGNLSRQLDPINFVRHVGAEVSRRALNPFASSSYAQTGEDILIASLLSWPKNGFYVDIGCHHPIRLSNTYFLYLRGLNGVCVDANPEFGNVFARYRPRDKFISACVGNQTGEVDFKVFKDRAVSSIAGNRLEGVSSQQYELERIDRMTVRPVCDILKEYAAPADFELLSIDVEEQDFSALKSTALHHYRPKLIVIELHGIDAGKASDHEVSVYLDDFGYRPVAIHRSNAFFLKIQG